MKSRERVMTALRGEQPDRVPYCELGIDRALAHRIMGWQELTSQAADLEANPYTVDEAKAIAATLGLDNIIYVLRAPVYARRIRGEDGRLFYGPGLLVSDADLPTLQLPNPADDQLYAEARTFAAQKGEYAAWFVTRIGISSTMLGMGIEHFSLTLFDNRAFLV